jgi:hypothetical protein
LKILVIPDTQVKPGVPINHLTAIGNFMVAKKPDVVVQIGDFADMESLSSYDVGKKSFEGRRYKHDIDAAHEAMELLLKPMNDYNTSAAKNHHQRYKPRRIVTYGNHEERILRAVESDPKLEGVLSMDDLGYEKKFGWETYPFLEPVIIGGVAFCHYFPSGVMGRRTTSARALLTKMHMSCVAGHLPGRDIAMGAKPDGTRITCIIAGSCYQHEEHYMAPMVNKQQWHGVFMLHEVENGSFDEMAVSLKYLLKEYGE